LCRLSVSECRRTYRRPAILLKRHISTAGAKNVEIQVDRGCGSPRVVTIVCAAVQRGASVQTKKQFCGVSREANDGRNHRYRPGLGDNSGVYKLVFGGPIQNTLHGFRCSVDLVHAVACSGAHSCRQGDGRDALRPCDRRRAPVRRGRQVKKWLGRADPDARRSVPHPTLQYEEDEVDVAGQAIARHARVAACQTSRKRRESLAHTARRGDTMRRRAVQDALQHPATEKVLGCGET